MSSYSPQNMAELFPFLKENSNNLIYFDNAATTHKPYDVIDSICDFYKNYNSNIHRSAHDLGFEATEKYEASRLAVCDFISAKKSSEIIFTSGATESINLVANSFGKDAVGPGDVILVSEIEHHSNMLPWQVLANEVGAVIRKIPLKLDLTVDLENFRKSLNTNVKLVAIHHVSNVTGIMQDIKSIVKESHNFNVPVFVDGAQAPAHIKVDVDDLNCDFYCFSGHKTFGPTGTGVLYGKGEYLKKMRPYKTGGQMVSKVSSSEPQWAELPLKFEAGTPNIAGVIGLSAAIECMQKFGIEKIMAIEEKLTSHLHAELNKIPHLTIYGDIKKAIPVFSFNIEGVHHSDLSALLSENNILVRSGHLCNQGLMNYLEIDGCLRVSLAFYNTIAEIDQFISVFKKILSFLSK